MRKRQFLLLFLLVLPLGETSAADPFEFGGDRLSSSFTEGQERTTLNGHARIVSGNLDIQADSIELWGAAFRFASCSGSVRVHDTKKNLILKADTMEYDRTLKTSRFQGLGEMEDADHGVTVRAGLFDYDETTEKVVIQTGVRIFKGDLVCRSEYAVYDRASDSLELGGLPEVYKKRDVYRAGIIRVNLKSEDVILDGRVSGTIMPDKKEETKKNGDKVDNVKESEKP
jgi:lipopolysaccharide export system protein LptA